MSRALQPASSSRDGAAFEIEQLEVGDGRLVISGHWSGVRGIRFVRPTLVAGGRSVLATLEHKPWAPAAGTPWIAAFPWKGSDVEVDELALAVAPSVTVQLGAQAAELVAEQPEPENEEPEPVAVAPEPRPPETVSPARLLRLQDDLAELALERDELERRFEQVQALNADLDVRCLELAQALRAQRGTAQDASEAREDLVRASATTERDRDRALAQVDEAVHDREAALRTRARMELQRDEALAVRDTAEAKLAKVIADRDEAAAQRDEVLLAYRALQQQMVSERVDADRERAGAVGRDPASAGRGGAGGSAGRAGVDREGTGAAPGDDVEQPLGVRTFPAGRTVMAELQRPLRERRLPVGKGDLWVMRVLGTVAALCFITLLVMILRAFI